MFDKHYEHKISEQKWQEHWEKSKVYKWDENVERMTSFVIDTPPPTVSGLLHMGHVYSYAQADFIARFQRMNGKNVFYPIGFDDNGLPTERLVEKDLKVRASKMDRGEFIKLCKKVVTKYEDEFRSLFKSIAFSFDWTQEYQTISDHTRKISQMSFIDLYNKNLLYRRNAPTFWDPVDQTAIAQAEIEDKEMFGIMSEIKFDTSKGKQITIATTRPEMLPACVAVFYHPDDRRYQKLHNTYAIVPIFGQKVPIIADDAVEIDKGTGLVMCCTFGDIQDIRWWQKHNLDLRECINRFGQMQNADFLDGLKVNAARDQVLERLYENDLILEQKEITRPVKCAERSAAPLEIIPSYQWYISVINQKEILLDQSNKCKWHPHYMKIRLDNWIKGLNQDWCISRQRYFGVQFPVWYSKRPGEEGKVIVAEIDQLPVDPMFNAPKGYSMDEVEPEKDVMDTWATSSLTPQISSYGLSDELAIDYSRHHRLFPADLRPQAHEIIRTWAFSTIVKSLHHQNSIPWKNLMISGWCLAADKTKMSKSKGNVVTPQKLIEEKGADVVRYWAANSKLGADIVYSDEAFKLAKKLINKLWNVAKFTSLHLPKANVIPMPMWQYVKEGIVTEALDLWLINRLLNTLNAATECFSNFEYCDAKSVIEEFFWKDLCDNYIELVKNRLYNDSNKAGQRSGVLTLSFALDNVLRMLSPFIPHMTEEIYQTIFPHQLDSIHQKGSWPQHKQMNIDADNILVGNSSIALLELVRKAKSSLNISIAKEVSLIEVVTNLSDIDLLTDFKNAANASEINLVSVISEGYLQSQCGAHTIKIHL